MTQNSMSRVSTALEIIFERNRAQDGSVLITCCPLGPHNLSSPLAQDGSVRVTDIRSGVGRETLSTGQPCFSLHHRSEVPLK